MSNFYTYYVKIFDTLVELPLQIVALQHLKLILC